jgi:hypothetical protein
LTPNDSAAAGHSFTAYQPGAEGLEHRIASAQSTPTSAMPIQVQADALGHQEAASRRLVEAFVDHARSGLDLPGDADSASVISAYFASHAGADASGRWLENDSPLMLCLAKASGLFAGEVGVADLVPGHRRLLARALVLSLTRPIDWRAALNADPANGAAVFYEGITLRNATQLSIKDAGPGPSTAGTQHRRPADTPASEVPARRPRLDDTARR